MRKKLLLFDIDGTLLLTSGAGMRAMQQVAVEMFGPEYDWEGISFAGSLDPAIFANFAGKHEIENHEEMIDEFHDRYINKLHGILSIEEDAAYTMPGIIELLEVLKSRESEQGDIVLGLLTGNFTAAGPIKLRAAGIDPGWFTLAVYGDEAMTRPGLVNVALDKFNALMGYRVNPKDVIIIGDTQHDVTCAHAHGCIAFAVATGKYDAKVLREAGADVVVDDLADPGSLMELIDM